MVPVGEGTGVTKGDWNVEGGPIGLLGWGICPSPTSSNSDENTNLICVDGNRMMHLGWPQGKKNIRSRDEKFQY